ncbi:MAG: XcyI family restriction endonuclease [Anaerolineae bacterium]|nr:XcyI family restriction endonuclease [Anaerolineae bacterium]
MPKKHKPKAHVETWTLDQLAKSAFFHRKLHEWKMLEIAEQIDQVQGENLSWDNLNISEKAWKKVIHRGIKPVVVFAHPFVLQEQGGSVGYYRMLAMVSQKSMKNIGIRLDQYESGQSVPDNTKAVAIAQHLNQIISLLIEADESIDPTEFVLWRGMAAGAQAQGSWQNNKGASAEVAIQEIILSRLQARKIISGEHNKIKKWKLTLIELWSLLTNPTLPFTKTICHKVVVEVKGGIDPAGVLERIGAALKSLQRTRQDNSASITVLVLADASMTEQAHDDLNLSTETVTHIFGMDEILKDEAMRESFFKILGI